MYQFAILLLPVAAASGWYFAYKHYQTPSKASATEQAGYFKGLNYLLNEQPDKAIDVFIDLLEVDDETIEIHLALGTLFRQRGEVEKSIRIHQNLIARPQISQETRFSVLNELGLDYMRAGLLDRAESIYLELESVAPHEVSAIKQLVAIYQQEKEWLKSIDYTLKLENISGTKTPKVLAHLHCEFASLYQHEDITQATSHLKKALNIEPQCVRANIIFAEIAITRSDHKRALKYLMNIVSQDPRFVPVYLTMFIDCLDQLGRRKQKLRFLNELQLSDTSSLVLGKFIEALRGEKGDEEALRFIHEKVLNTPQKKHLKLYAKLVLSQPVQDETKFLCEAITQLNDDVSSFQCTSCGFTSTHLNWCCPSCKQWGEAEPRLG